MSSQTEVALPKGFIQLRDVLDLQFNAGQIVNVMGSIIDIQAAYKTSNDYKTTWTLTDPSIEDEPHGVKLNIFRPREADIPEIGYQDVVVVHKVKVQRYGGNMSFITNHQTTIRVYESSKIPQPPKSAAVALRPCIKKDERPELTKEIHHLVAVFYQKLDKTNAPSEDAFLQAAQQSANIKDKFSLLQDVQADKFYDLIVRIVRQPHFDFEKATLYVSDYTENPAFHDHLPDKLDGGQDGDAYGYTSQEPAPAADKWIAPEGKRSLQLTCWEPHIRVLQGHVKLGSWIKLKNVQIRYGHDFKHLEGFVREDQKYRDRINIHPLNPEDRENMDNRLKVALRRQQASDKEKKKLIKDIKSAHIAGQKRKALEVHAVVEQPPLNSRGRRNENRALKQKKKEEQAHQNVIAASPMAPSTKSDPPKPEPTQDLTRVGNQQVICEQVNVSITPIRTMLEPSFMHVKMDTDTVKVPVPFVNKKYLSFVRVVDFSPARMEDFAVSRKITQYQDLSDSENSGESSLDEDESSGGDDDPTVKHVWEWRFSLLLEDASPAGGSSPSQVWVVVNNGSGQCLTNLDADDLRKNRKLLSQFQDRMCILWGNLEDVKASKEAAKSSKQPLKKEVNSRPVSRGSNGNRIPMPDLDSDEEEEEANVPTRPGKSGLNETGLFNKPFTCCIKQYGVKTGKKDEWVRVFAMDGVRIKDV
ncbi:hypothetical protein QBC41DRAFT_65972 [Cercophora samala]|uniref:Protection of telomeres protein 1 n=1 Tax=Cercophora samala TaxID=330535 RepID=A0AA39ZGW5_9PEZI|nr:hypothetical protein QBC41DRAFT_65972 [Cercophora samala]